MLQSDWLTRVEPERSPIAGEKKCISPFLLKDRANLENFHQVSLVNLAQLAQLAKLAWST